MARTALLLLSLALPLGCSGTTANSAARAVSGPFSPELAALFDDSVDYVENVEELGGRVASDWRRQIDGCARGADVIAVVRVETITSGSESTSSASYRLTTVASRDPLKGTLPADRRTDLMTSQGEVGYNTVRAGSSRIQAREWLMFVRWYDDADGQVRPHWHLTPATEQALQRARDAIGYVDPNAPREQVVRPVTN
ncbi:MAG: hypothetical protein U0324_02630 [Polyangiales bacterium]